MNLSLIVSSADFKFGLIITIVGIGVVFSALAVLNIIFNQIPKLFKVQIRSKLRKAGKVSDNKDCCPDISGETHAAIALALHLYMNELHDSESNVMTIAKVSKRYSPWSSKIYGLRSLNYHK
ncbi:MAG: OadG family protein [Bacteroidales bacterium]|jgi:Na+-transporting methylmalonyl-CoA/oxaloacetate decarboxylase gamma subunit